MGSVITMRLVMCWSGSVSGRELPAFLLLLGNAASALQIFSRLRRETTGLVSGGRQGFRRIVYLLRCEWNHSWKLLKAGSLLCVACVCSAYFPRLSLLL